MRRLVLILVTLLGSLLVATGATAQQPGQAPVDTTRRAMPGPQMPDRATMMKMMDSTDARLGQLVATMNQATGSRKVEAMAAVINELVTQRKMMRAHMGWMMNSRGMSGHPGDAHPGVRMMQEPRKP